MRDYGVNQDEMAVFSQISDSEATRLFEGNPPAEGMEDLAAFFRDLKESSVAAPAPEVESAHLAAIMGEVALLGSPEASTQVMPVQSAVPTARSLPRLRILGLKLAAAGLGAVMLMGGLAAADVLPDPVQKVVSKVAEAVTPFDFPEPPAPRSEFGQKVSGDAKDTSDPGVSGKQVSEDAKSQGRSDQAPAGPPAGAGQPPGPGREVPPDTPGRGRGSENRTTPVLPAPAQANQPGGPPGPAPKSNVGGLDNRPAGPAGPGVSGPAGGPGSGHSSGSGPSRPDAPTP